MQSLIPIIAVFVCIYAIVWIKNYGYSFFTSLRIFVKRLALYIMSFSWIIILATVLMIACYSNISGLLKDILSANSIEGIKSFTRLIFGVDSAFVALQMLALYSIMASFVSCLVLSLGVVVRVIYRTILKVSRTSFSDGCQSLDDFESHSVPTFKLYLKYNS